MLVPAPYVVLEKKAKKKATGTRKGLRRKVAPDASPEDDEAHSSHDGKEKKRKRAAPFGEAEGSKKAAAGTRKGLRRKAVIDSSSEDGEAVSSHGDGGKHEEMPPPRTGEEKKRKAASQGEARTPKKGKASLPDNSTSAAYSKEEWLPRRKPRAKS